MLAVAIAAVITRLKPNIPWPKAYEIAQSIAEAAENPDKFWGEINHRLAKLDEVVDGVTG